jgi:hypothetical protein
MRQQRAHGNRFKSLINAASLARCFFFCTNWYAASVPSQNTYQVSLNFVAWSTGGLEFARPQGTELCGWVCVLDSLLFISTNERRFVAPKSLRGHPPSHARQAACPSHAGSHKPRGPKTCPTSPVL